MSNSIPDAVREFLHTIAGGVCKCKEVPDQAAICTVCRAIELLKTTGQAQPAAPSQTCEGCEHLSKSSWGRQLDTCRVTGDVLNNERTEVPMPSKHCPKQAQPAAPSADVNALANRLYNIIQAAPSLETAAMECAATIAAELDRRAGEIARLTSDAAEFAARRERLRVAIFETVEGMTARNECTEDVACKELRVFRGKLDRLRDFVAKVEGHCGKGGCCQVIVRLLKEVKG